LSKVIKSVTLKRESAWYFVLNKPGISTSKFVAQTGNTTFIYNIIDKDPMIQFDLVQIKHTKQSKDQMFHQCTIDEILKEQKNERNKQKDNTSKFQAIKRHVSEIMAKTNDL